MSKKNLFSLLPKVDELLNDDKIKELISTSRRGYVIEHIREQINKIRKEIVSLDENKVENFKIDEEKIISNIVSAAENERKMNLRRVINATGTVLHTNLGRSLIDADLKEYIWDAVSNYSNLEYDIKTGKRGSRYSHVEEVLRKLTGAESALVVNNNAAAILLVLSTMAKNKEVVVSRGQLVEIGGSFRVPEVMEQGGAILKEIGTTNKTHANDYDEAINEETGILLKVHTSNYKILGFTKEVEVEELVTIGKKRGIPVVEDIGSGTLVDFSKYGVTKEPTVQESIEAGVDVVTFSGDKLLGGPQAGIIVGKKEFIEKMKKNPLTRAIRIDKLTLAALEGTLRKYLTSVDPTKDIPVLKMITATKKELKSHGEKLYNLLTDNLSDFSIQIQDGFSQIGGGSMPTELLDSTLIKLSHKNKSASFIEKKMRENNIPIVGRISDENVILDVRTLKEDEFHIIKECLLDIEKMA